MALVRLLLPLGLLLVLVLPPDMVWKVWSLLTATVTRRLFTRASTSLASTDNAPGLAARGRVGSSLPREAQSCYALQL